MTSRFLVAAAAGLGVLSGLPARIPAQSLAITSSPNYGASGSITGIVSGVANPAAHGVAVYIHIEGAGVWTKPTFAAPVTPVLANGTFTANVTSGGLDDRATVLCAVLLPPGFTTPPVAAGAATFPVIPQALATACVERYAATLSFAGRTWGVKESPAGVGPGGNLFSAAPSDVWVDAQGRLHLTVRSTGGAWRSTEVILLESLGYGTYAFTTESQVGYLDPNLTFGAFPWDVHGGPGAAPGAPNREIDFEDSRWGQPSDPTTSQVVVQPWTVPGNLIRYTTPLLAPGPSLSRRFTWEPGRIAFTAAAGRRTPCATPAASVLHQSVYLHNPALGHHVPTPGQARFRFNLWVNAGGGPSNGLPAEVIVSDFRFSPVAGAFPLGCGTNPRGSLGIVSGTPTLGATLVLGLDHPFAPPAGTGPIAAVLAIGAAPDPAVPCGTLLPGFGPQGGPGELLVLLAPGSWFLLPGSPWTGPGNASTVAIPIPNDPALSGFAAYLQGLLFPTSPGGPSWTRLTDGFELCLS